MKVIEAKAERVMKIDLWAVLVWDDELGSWSWWGGDSRFYPSEKEAAAASKGLYHSWLPHIVHITAPQEAKP